MAILAPPIDRYRPVIGTALVARTLALSLPISAWAKVGRADGAGDQARRPRRLPAQRPTARDVRLAAGARSGVLARRWRGARLARILGGHAARRHRAPVPASGDLLVGQAPELVPRDPRGPHPTAAPDDAQ